MSSFEIAAPLKKHTLAGSNGSLNLVVEENPVIPGDKNGFEGNIKGPGGRHGPCSLGTGEVVHILALRAKSDEHIDAFEAAVQSLTRDLYKMEAGITDSRVCHPCHGRVAFVLTFTGVRELTNFRRGPEKQLRDAMKGLCAGCPDAYGITPTFSSSASNSSPSVPSPVRVNVAKKLGRLHHGGYLEAVLKTRLKENGISSGAMSPIEPSPTPRPGSSGSDSEIQEGVANLEMSKNLLGMGTGEFVNDIPEFECTGCLMPMTHTLKSLVDFLKNNIIGKSHTDHNVKLIADECSKWFPRKEEYEKYISWDSNDPKKYTRNVVYKNDNFECLLMCWPAGCNSSIHCHDKSSCWVVLVEGEVHEVQYAMPKLDKKFLDSEMRDPTGAIGRCGELRYLKETKMSFNSAATVAAKDGDLDSREDFQPPVDERDPGISVAYANNDIGIHRIENRNPTKPAYTLHIYAPGLEKIKIFKEDGKVWVHSVAATAALPPTSSTGINILDVDGWNEGAEY